MIKLSATNISILLWVISLLWVVQTSPSPPLACTDPYTEPGQHHGVVSHLVLAPLEDVEERVEQVTGDEEGVAYERRHPGIREGEGEAQRFMGAAHLCNAPGASPFTYIL